MKADLESSGGETRDPALDDAGRRVAIVVCSSCRDATGSDAHPRAGERLAADTRDAASYTDIRVEVVECLGNCRRRLSAAIVKDGAWHYVFGDLTETSGADLVSGALLFAATTDDILPWRGRPDALKKGLVARIPPVFTRPGSSSKDPS